MLFSYRYFVIILILLFHSNISAYTGIGIYGGYNLKMDLKNVKLAGPNLPPETKISNIPYDSAGLLGAYLNH